MVEALNITEQNKDLRLTGEVMKLVLELKTKLERKMSNLKQVCEKNC